MGGTDGVPRRLGTIDWRRVKFPADVTAWSSTTILRPKTPLRPIVAVYSVFACVFWNVVVGLPTLTVDNQLLCNNSLRSTHLEY